MSLSLVASPAPRAGPSAAVEVSAAALLCSVALTATLSSQAQRSVERTGFVPPPRLRSGTKAPLRVELVEHVADSALAEPEHARDLAPAPATTRELNSAPLLVGELRRRQPAEVAEAPRVRRQAGVAMPCPLPLGFPPRVGVELVHLRG